MDHWRFAEAGVDCLAAQVVEASLNARMSVEQCPLVSAIFANGPRQIATVCGSSVGQVRFYLLRVGTTVNVYGGTFVSVRDAGEHEKMAAAYAAECRRALEERGWRFIYWA